MEDHVCQPESDAVTSDSGATRAGLFIAGAAVLAICLMALQPVRSPDVWHHVGSGRFVVQNRGPASVDVFSCTAQGKRWLQFEWLSQLLLYGVHEAGGVSGLLLVRIVAAAGMAVFLLVAARRRGANGAASAIAVALAACVMSGRFFSRPEIFTLLLMAAFMVSVEKLRKGKTRWFFVPALLMAPWVNMHGAWVAGIAYLGLVCAGETAPRLLRLKKAASPRTLKFLWLALALAMAATLVNPYGWHIWEVPFSLSRTAEVRAHIAEWKPPTLDTWLDSRNIGVFLFVGSLILAPSAISIADALAILFFGFLAFTARRHLTLAMLVTAPIFARQLSLIWDRSLLSRKPVFSRGVVRVGGTVVICAAAALTALGGFHLPRAGVGLDKKVYPVAAVDFLETHDLKGNLFNAYSFGNYLLYRRYPDNRVFIDGRVDMYGSEIVKLFTRVRRANEGWQQILKDHDIEIAVLEISKRSDIPIVVALHRSPEWALCYWDNLSAIYVRATPARKAFLDSVYVYKVRPDRLDDTFLSSPEGLARAEADYRRKLAEDPTTLFAMKGLTQCLDRRGETAEVAAVLRNALVRLPDDVELHYNLGVILLRMKQYDEAEKELRIALRLGGHEEAAAWSSLASIALARNDPHEALRCLRKAVRLAPRQWKLYWSMSLICEQQGDFAGAIRSMEEVIRLRPNDRNAQERLDMLKQKRGARP